jgi:hypothetical protein
VRVRYAWVVGAAGVAAVALAGRRVFSRRSSLPLPTDPADDLRRKLDESRALGTEREELEAGETTVDRAATVPETLEERRRRIHERAQAAVEEMRADEPGETDA